MTPAPKPPSKSCLQMRQATRQAGRQADEQQRRQQRQRGRQATCHTTLQSRELATVREREMLSGHCSSRYLVPGTCRSPAHAQVGPLRASKLPRGSGYVERALRIGLAAMQRASQINSLKLQQPEQQQIGMVPTVVAPSGDPLDCCLAAAAGPASVSSSPATMQRFLQLRRLHS